MIAQSSKKTYRERGKGSSTPGRLKGEEPSGLPRQDPGVAKAGVKQASVGREKGKSGIEKIVMRSGGG